jgi:hypothetical protein
MDGESNTSLLKAEKAQLMVGESVVIYKAISYRYEWTKH